MTRERIPSALIGESTEEARRLLILVYSFYNEFQKLPLWNELDHTDQQVPRNFLLGDGGESVVRAFTQHAQGPVPSLIPPPLLNPLIFCWGNGKGLNNYPTGAECLSKARTANIKIQMLGHLKLASDHKSVCNLKAEERHRSKPTPNNTEQTQGLLMHTEDVFK